MQCVQIVNSAITEVARICRGVLSNTLRLLIMVVLLLKGSCTLGELQAILGVPLSTLEYHIQELVKHGYVAKKRVLCPDSGTRVVLEITERGVRETLEYLRLLQEVASAAIKRATAVSPQ